MRRLLAGVCALGFLLPGASGAQDVSAAASSDLQRLRRGESIAALPPADSISPGARTIEAGAVVNGTVLARGPIIVAGHVNGTVVSLGGDVSVPRGGVVTGDALSVGGRVIADGTIMGEMRSMSALPTVLTAAAPALAARTPFQRTMDSARMVAATFGVLLIVAIGVLLFAGRNLDEVVSTLELRFARAFWIGLLGQVLLLPALAVLVVALALTVIGLLLIPFAIVAYCIAAAGLVTLGFLAVARLVGGSMTRDGEATPRSRALTGLAIGVAVFFVVWMIAALLSWSPLTATIVRAAAVAMTWAAITLGFGAALLSRAGTHRRVAGGARPVELASWQTPTPLTGVVAARRTAAEVR